MRTVATVREAKESDNVLVPPPLSVFFLFSCSVCFSGFFRFRSLWQSLSLFSFFLFASFSVSPPTFSFFLVAPAAREPQGLSEQPDFSVAPDFSRFWAITLPALSYSGALGHNFRLFSLVSVFRSSKN